MIEADLWFPSGGISLEPNALTAATQIECNLALTAGPGAGKTEMLAQRADFLLRVGICRYPKRILAISFKVDASQNLRLRVRRRCGGEMSARFDSYTFHAFAKRIIDQFRVALTGRDALDPDYSVGPQRIQRRSITYEDMVPLALSIVESNSIARNAIRRAYSHVLLDEFQDCTSAQYRLIRACFGNTQTKLTAVGDTKQRIMAWAGALDGIFEIYARDFVAEASSLYANFRSKARLRRMQNAMVRVMDAPGALKDEDLLGGEGEIRVLRFADDDEEANQIAEAMRSWIKEESVEPNEIAVLVSKQQNLYCQKLRKALELRGVPFRVEDRAQDLACEPVAMLIVDFLIVASGDQSPGPHGRLLSSLILNSDFDEEREYEARSNWDRFIRATRRKIAADRFDFANRDALRTIANDLVEYIGRDALVALSASYVYGDRLEQLIHETIDHVHELLATGNGVTTALSRFSGERAVRLMTIHKSKGLEFDTVVLLGVENESFWSDQEAERAAFFVGISRAKRRLLLTVSQVRVRPAGAAANWRSVRSEHLEFIGYATPYL
jgi:superfamily I DNA/RNA helicase